jgi:hypothetical protein
MPTAVSGGSKRKFNYVGMSDSTLFIVDKSPVIELYRVGGSPGRPSGGSLVPSETDISILPVGAANRIRKYSKAAQPTNTAIRPTSTVFENRVLRAKLPVCRHDSPETSGLFQSRNNEEFADRALIRIRLGLFRREKCGLRKGCQGPQYSRVQSHSRTFQEVCRDARCTKIAQRGRAEGGSFGAPYLLYPHLIDGIGDRSERNCPFFLVC